MAYQKKRRKKELWSPENSETQTGMLEMEKETHRTVTALRSTWVNSSINSLKWQFLQNCPKTTAATTATTSWDHVCATLKFPRIGYKNRESSNEPRESRIKNREPRTKNREPPKPSLCAWSLPPFL